LRRQQGGPSPPPQRRRCGRSFELGGCFPCLCAAFRMAECYARVRSFGPLCFSGGISRQLQLEYTSAGRRFVAPSPSRSIVDESATMHDYRCRVCDNATLRTLSRSTVDELATTGWRQLSVAKATSRGRATMRPTQWDSWVTL
jgi:hypothetical protein